jgi:hypothetical protein
MSILVFMIYDMSIFFRLNEMRCFFPASFIIKKNYQKMKSSFLVFKDIHDNSSINN